MKRKPKFLKTTHCRLFCSINFMFNVRSDYLKYCLTQNAILKLVHSLNFEHHSSNDKSYTHVRK